jgi:hypothetical protein
VELVRRLHSGRTLADAIRKVRGRRIGLTRKLAKGKAATSAPAVESSSASPLIEASATAADLPTITAPDQQAGIDIPPAVS